MSKLHKKNQSKGVATIEYIILLGLIAVIAIPATLTIGTTVSDTFNDVGLHVADAQPNVEISPSTSDTPEYPFVRDVGDVQALDPGTTLSCPAPSGAQIGDLLVTFLMHRSDLAQNEDWTTVASRQATANPQTLTILEATHSNDLNYAFTQESEDRIRCITYAIGGDDPQIAETKTLSGYHNVYSDKIYPMPGFVHKSSKSIVLGAASYVMAYTTEPSLVTVSEGWTMENPSQEIGNRLLSAWMTSGPDDFMEYETPGYFTADSPNTQYYSSAIVQVTHAGKAESISQSIAEGSQSYEQVTDLQPDSWMRLKEKVYPSDPADTFIRNEQLAGFVTGGTYLSKEDYNLSYSATLETQDDGSGLIRVNIGRGHGEEHPPHEAQALSRSVVGSVVWYQFQDDPGVWHAAQLIPDNDRTTYIRQVGSIGGMNYIHDTRFLGWTRDEDPRNLYYDDGKWYRKVNR